MVYSVALQAPNRQQWETDSQYSQAYNCGPTCVAFIAGFYKDNRWAIEYCRRSIASMGPYYGVGSGPVMGAPARTPTNGWQQRDMLIKKGVPATVRSVDSVAQLHGLVDSGRRPTLVGIEMSRVPATIRGHSFTGWHAVVVISGAVQNGVVGFWVMDPNFSAGSPASRRFYSNSLMQTAWANNSPRWCVVPDAAKPTAAAPTPYVKFNTGVDGVNMRGGPDARKNNILAKAYKDTDPKPNGVIRESDKKRLCATSARFKLGATVKGPDLQYYYRIAVTGITAPVYVQTRFMHRG